MENNEMNATNAISTSTASNSDSISSVDCTDCANAASTNNDTYAMEAMLPAETDCSSDLVAPLDKKQHKVTVLDEGNTVTKYLFRHHRLSLYKFLTRELHNGHLSEVVGFKILNRVINREACFFPMGGVSFWKIDRKNLYADVKVEMKLQSADGVREWQGVLVCIVSFESESTITVSCESIERSVDHKADGCDPISAYTVGYYTSKEIDAMAEAIWAKYLPEALSDPTKRNPEELARRMGLDIKYLDVYDHKGIPATLFFKEGDILIGEDKVDEFTGEHHKTDAPVSVTIPANTIVVNTNVVEKKYAAFDIFHECTHYVKDYMFYRLQEVGNNDPKGMKTKEIIVEEGHELHDPLYFMEKQADRGGFGLMMPATHTEQLIRQECAKVKEFQNEGELYETVGLRICAMLRLPHFRVRARMIQLGHYQAKGALNYVNHRLIQPFAFKRESLSVEVLTFVIPARTLYKLAEKSERLNALLESGRYIYADGHVVRNDPRYVKMGDGELILTNWARSHVDECCLRFIKVYVQKMVGKYVLGRMYHDAEYIVRTEEFLKDIMRAEEMDEIDARMAYKERFPRKIVDAFDQVMKANGYTRERTADELGISVRTLYDRLHGKKAITLDFIVRVCLLWKLPDWISYLLLDRANLKLSEHDKRHQAIEYILHVLWSEGIERADSFLESKGLETLKR